MAEEGEREDAAFYEAQGWEVDVFCGVVGLCAV